MIPVRQDDVLRGLKKFKRLAKQDLLASPLTQDPGFWSAQAEARRAQYAEFMELVERRGVDAAYQVAVEGYAALPLVRVDGRDPKLSGLEQAYEMFFAVLGIDQKEIARLRNGRRRLTASDEVAMKASL